MISPRDPDRARAWEEWIQELASDPSRSPVRRLGRDGKRGRDVAAASNGAHPETEAEEGADVRVRAESAEPMSDSDPKVADGSPPVQFLNRELSLLEFQWRVLFMAQDPSVPLLERLRFLTISTSNLDEFFEIRVAGLKQHIALEVTSPNPENLSAAEVYRRLSANAHRLVEEQYRILNDELLPALEEQGIRVLKRANWNEAQARWLREYFRKEVLPLLTPIGLDPAHPFPRIVNKTLCFIISLKGKDAFGRMSRAAVVQAPRMVPRLIALPREHSEQRDDCVLLSSIIHEHVAELFPGMKITGCYQFRVTRDSDLWVDEEEVDNLLSALKGELLSRRFGGAARLEVADNCPQEMQEFLLAQFGLASDDLYRVNGPVNLYRLSALCDLVDRPDLKYRPFTPATISPRAPGVSIFDVIRKGDILLHHPFQSIVPVVDLLKEAASDPTVLAIKQTVYRTGVRSPLSEALIEAARAGKEVTAVVELRARFDEAANIDLATQLQEAGATVAYGIVGYKAHAKMLMVVRREGNVLRRYVHLGTGNYHVGNTRNYTDIGILTCDDGIGEDVHNLFQQMTGLGRVSSLKKLLQSPFTLHSALLGYIAAETAAARAGKKARIIAKLNALIEPQIIRALYEASQAGVEIDLIVRGICCLVPGVPGVSDNIRVRSTLGRFLEHSRIYYFHAGGEDLTFCSSADWMERNFFRRVEIAFPIENRKLRRRVFDEGLRPYLEENAHTWELSSSGSYSRVVPNGAPALSAQKHLLEVLVEKPPLVEDQLVPSPG